MMLGFSKASLSSEGWFCLHVLGQCGGRQQGGSGSEGWSCLQFYGCHRGLPSSPFFLGLDIRLLG